MSLIWKKLKNKVSNNFAKFIALSKVVSIPGFQKVPVYYVVRSFLKGILNSDLNTKAASIAYSFFLAAPPSLIFFFTLIPYLPIDNIQLELLNIVNDLLPHNAFASVNHTLQDIITKPRGNLLSFSFFIALIFSTNGIASFISAFNASYHIEETRSWLAQRAVSFVLVIIFSLLLLAAIVSIVFGTVIMNYLTDFKFVKDDFVMNLIIFIKWIIVISFFYFTISFMYYLAPSEKLRFRFFSVGSTFATIGSILASLIFSFYIDNFGQYNKLYGSIGTIMVLLVWLFINAWVILLGFDLNGSIVDAKKK